MNTNTQTNVQQSLFSGDNELMKIDVYLDARFGQRSMEAITLMADIAELKKMLTEEVVHFVFEKTDGTRRDAYGTRAIDVIRKYARERQGAQCCPANLYGLYGGLGRRLLGA